MHCKRFLAAVAILACLTVLAYRGLAGDDAAAPEKPGDDFAGKVILLHTDQEMEILSQILTDVAFQEIRGKLFLVGTSAETDRGDDWRAGKKVYVAWDRVVGYMLLTKEEFKQYLREANDEEKAA
jgi:hypothetical protein